MPLPFGDFFDRTKRRRPTLLSEPPEEFVENRVAPEISAVTKRNSLYEFDRPNLQVAVFGEPTAASSNNTALAIFDPAKKAQLEFRDHVLSIWKKKGKATSSSEVSTEVFPELNVTWEDLLEGIQNEIEKYHNVGAGRAAMRKVGERAGAMRAWLSLFPESMYSSTLVSGFKMALDVAEKLDDVRQRALEYLMELPEQVAKANLMLDIFNEKSTMKYASRLHGKISELYTAILSAVWTIISWMQKKSKKKVFSALCDGPLYGKDIDKALDDVSKHVLAVNEAATACHMQISKETNQGQKTLLAGMDEVKSTMAMLQADISVAADKFEMSQKEVMQQEIERRVEMAARQLFGTFVELCAASPKMEKYRQALQPPELAIQTPIRRRRTHCDGIIEKCQHDKATLHKDLHECLNASQSIDSEARSRAAWIAEKVFESEWVRSAQSEILLIHGEGADDGISTVSFLAAHLIKGLQSANIQYCYFFCGLHISSSNNDPLAGPAGMMRSLIGQFLSWENFDVRKLNKTLQSRNDYNKIGKLCTAFRSLVSQLPEGSLFYIIIDNITAYETLLHGRLDKMIVVLQKFFQMLGICGSSKKKAAATVKILLTSPARSYHFVKELPFKKCQILDAEENGTSRASMDFSKVQKLPTVIATEEVDV